MTWRAILGVESGTPGTKRTERTEPTTTAGGAEVLSFVSFASGGSAARSAAQWRARFAVSVAIQRHVYGYPPADARRRGYFDVLVERTEADPELRTLPSSEAEPLARAALEALGIVEPRAGTR